MKREQRKKTAERKRFSVVLALCLCLTMIAMSAIDLNVFAAGNGEQVTPALQGELTEGGQEGAGDPGSEPADNTGGDPAGDTNGGEGTSGAETDPKDPPTDPQGEPGTGEDPADPGSQGEGETPAGEQGETEDPGKQDPGTGEDPGKTEDPGQNDPEETEDPGTETEDPGTETEDPQSGEEESGKEETEDPGEETPEDPEEETPVEELPEDVQEEKKAEEEAEAQEAEAQEEAEAQKQEAEEEAAAEQEKIEAARKEAEEQEALAAAEAAEAARRAQEIEEATQRAREEAAAGEDEDEEFSTQDPFNYIEKYYVPDVIGHYAYPLTSEAYISYYFGSHDELHHNGHDGVDLAIAMGTPVLAAEKGVVVEAHQWLGTVGDGYGNYILIKHPDGNMTRYAHLSEINVKAGQQVVRGQQIGRVGSTGRSTGPHLHFEVITPNGLTDPLPFINAHDWNIGVGIKGTGGSIHIRNSEGLETAIHRSAAGKLCYTEALGGTEVAPGAKYHIINERPDQEVSFKVYYAPGYRVSAVRKTKDGKQYPVTFTGGNGVLSFKLPSQDDETVLEVTFIAVGSTAREAVLVNRSEAEAAGYDAVSEEALDAYLKDRTFWHQVGGVVKKKGNTTVQVMVDGAEQKTSEEAEEIIKIPGVEAYSLSLWTEEETGQKRKSTLPFFMTEEGGKALSYLLSEQTYASLEAEPGLSGVSREERQHAVQYAIWSLAATATKTEFDLDQHTFLSEMLSGKEYTYAARLMQGARRFLAREAKDAPDCGETVFAFLLNADGAADTTPEATTETAGEAPAEEAPAEEPCLITREEVRLLTAERNANQAVQALIAGILKEFAAAEDAAREKASREVWLESMPETLEEALVLDQMSPAARAAAEAAQQEEMAQLIEEKTKAEVAAQAEAKANAQEPANIGMDVGDGYVTFRLTEGERIGG